MGGSVNKNRRQFLKTSVAAATGVSVAGVSVEKIFAAPAAWAAGMQINPNVDNLRVVCVTDTTMTTGIPTKWDAATQNSKVVRDRIHANMDAMAIKLVEPKKAGATADEAWKLIIRLPANKTWDQVKVAFKVNCLEKNLCTRFAVIEKLCLVLNGWGVPFSNMYIFDRISDAYSAYAAYVGNGKPLPADVVVCHNSTELGGTKQVSITGFGAGHDCVGNLADGLIDLLINCPSNKGHTDAADHGLVTLSLKNHYGTLFTANQHQGFGYTVAMNKSDYIIGGNPPRQQLVFCDSLYSMTGGPNGAPDNKWTNKLIMGVFGPALDFLVGTRVRGGTASTFNMYLTNFDYVAADFANLDLVTVTPAPVVQAGSASHAGNQDRARLMLSLSGSSYRNADIDLVVPRMETMAEISIYDVKGRLVKTLKPALAGSRVLWDARTSGGDTAPAGRYLVRAVSQGYQVTSPLVLVK
jgi:hypothetical protein